MLPVLAQLNAAILGTMLCNGWQVLYGCLMNITK